MKLLCLGTLWEEDRQGIYMLTVPFPSSLSVAEVHLLGL
jgi:hypothetical protein